MPSNQTSPRFTRSSYRLPPVLLDAPVANKSVEFINCAFRGHNPQAGLTGGPNGVLALVKQIFGHEYRGFPMRYVFSKKRKGLYPPNLRKAIKPLSPMVQLQIKAEYYISNCIPYWSRLSARNELVFVCHDMGSAYAAQLRGRPYVFINHTQGSFVHERESFGEDLSDEDKRVLNEIERSVSENALYVCFPSKGAKQAFKDTIAFDDANVNYYAKPLYNSIPPAPSGLDPSALWKKLGVDDVKKDGVEVFLSVGDYSYNKGVDQIPSVLSEYVNQTGKKVHWIAIGSSHKTDIYQTLCSERSSWNFESTLIGKRVDHGTLLSLMRLADCYIMMHRFSIFDLSTLEAMRSGVSLFLAPVGGNLELDISGNVHIIDPDNVKTSLSECASWDIEQDAEINRQVFNEHFSPHVFKQSYQDLYDDILNNLGIDLFPSTIFNREQIGSFKDTCRSRCAVICGAGSSLAALDLCALPQNSDLFALNSAALNSNISFDAMFMQDYPANGNIEDYDALPIRKYYGIITNPAPALEEIKGEEGWQLERRGGG